MPAYLLRRLVPLFLLLPLALLLAACGDPAEREAQLQAESEPGELTYRRFCLSCHGSGAAGAPRVGDTREWERRLQAGRETLLQNTIDGLPGMPPRGLCARCDDEELDAAIGYMLERSLGES